MMSRMAIRGYSSLCRVLVARQQLATKLMHRQQVTPVLTTAVRAYRDESNVLEHGNKELVVSDTANTTDKPSAEFGIDTFGLHPTLVANLKDNFNITHLFPIQAKVMKPIKAGQDVIGKSKTGTGKTLAFLLPIIDEFVKAGYPRPNPGEASVVIMEPTRELANQVARELEKLDPRIRVTTLYGGSPYEPQIRALRAGVHVIVATPGRLIDHVESGNVQLANTKHVILDEADEMLRVGFAETVERLMQEVGEDRQTVLFSATVPKWIAGLAMKYTKNYAYIDCAVSENGDVTPSLITHKACMFPRNNTDVPAVLLSLINSYSNHGRCIIFSETKAFASELETALNQTIAQMNPNSSNNRRSTYAAALHGDISQNTRESILANFREGRLQVLVATDVAARGIDIPDVDLVLQMGIPKEVESYVHRSGRTGRAGKKGTCVLMYKHGQRGEMASLSAATGVRFSQVLASDVADNGVSDGVVKKVRAQVLRGMSTIDQKLDSTRLAVEKNPDSAVTPVRAAQGLAEELRKMYAGREDQLLTALLENQVVAANTDHQAVSFSILNSNPGHSTIAYSDQYISPRGLTDALSQGLKIDASAISVRDYTSTSQGTYFDVPVDVADLIDGAILRGELQGFSIPERLPAELFQQRGGSGASSSSRGGYGGSSGGRGGSRQGGFGGGGNRDGGFGGRGGGFNGGNRDGGYGGGNRDGGYGGGNRDSRSGGFGNRDGGFGGRDGGRRF